MSGNVNVANFCNFGSDRTRNVRVNQGPGGNSSINLAWNDDGPKQNARNNSNNYYQRESNSYGNQYQNQYSGQKNNVQKYNPITNNYNMNNYSNDTRNENTYNQKNYQNDNFDQNQVFGQQKKVNQNGRQQFSIGGDYNYFKDDQGGSKGLSSQNKKDDYQPLRNNNRNVQPNEYQPNYQADYNKQYSANNYANNYGGNNRSTSQNVYNYEPQSRNQNQPTNNYSQQQNNLPRQPNNLHDVKFGYRVNQPPDNNEINLFIFNNLGGRSNITFG